jgi:hypothetical protein
MIATLVANKTQTDTHAGEDGLCAH